MSKSVRVRMPKGVSTDILIPTRVGHTGGSQLPWVSPPHVSEKVGKGVRGQFQSITAFR